MNRMGRLATLALAASWLAAGPPAAQAGDRLVYTGDVPATTGFMRDLALLFQAETGIAVELRVADATTSLRATARGESNLGGTSRPLLDDPRETGLTLFPVAWDALAVVVHPDNPADAISLLQLGAVLQGELDHWRPLGGPDAPINLHMPADPLSGVRYNLRERLFDDPGAPMDVDRPALDTRTLQEAVAADRHGLGVTSLGAARASGLKVLAVDGVKPSPDSLAAGTYALFQPLQIAVAGGDERAERFVRFAQSPLARRILRRNGVVPYMDGLGLVRHQFDRENALRRAAHER